MNERSVRLGNTTPSCPVCVAACTQLLLAAADKTYWSCGKCQCRFLDPDQRLSREAEFAHYLNHRNDPADAGYRRFLAKLIDPLLARLPAMSRGLDYGCGPGPALAAMLREAGHNVALYDPFFCPDKAVLDDIYDFVTCTETAEHFHDPAVEFRRLMAIIRPGGLLAVMTCFQTDDKRFASWHYRMDPTHVVFYREHTLRFVASAAGWQCEVPVKDVVLMRKPMASRGSS